MNLRCHRLSVLLVCILLGACVQSLPRSLGLLDITERPAERSLLAGLRAYEDAQYPEAEKLLAQALETGLSSARDRAAAHKTLAFIYCTSNRAAKCESEFRSAREADPAFSLSKSEAGHPLWGPVYKRVQP